MKRHYIILGAGGFAAEVFNWVTSADYHNEILGFYAEYTEQKTLFNLPIFTSLEEAAKEYSEAFFIAAVGDPALKRKFNTTAISSGLTPCPGILSKQVVWGCMNSLGNNSIVCPNSTITTRVSIGYGCVVNINCSIGHDVIVGDFSTILPGSNISGNVVIGGDVVVGSNVSIREKITIADNVFIGMGSVVVKDILEPGTYVGNPVRKIR